LINLRLPKTCLPRPWLWEERPCSRWRPT